MEMQIEEIAQDIIKWNTKSDFQWIMQYEGQILKDLVIIDQEKQKAKRMQSTRFSTVGD